MKYKIAAFFLFVGLSAFSQVDMREALDSASTLVKDNPMVFSPSRLGSIEYYFGKYYLADNDKHIEISEQLATLLIRSFSKIKRSPITTDRTWKPIQGNSSREIDTTFEDKRIVAVKPNELYLLDYATGMAQQISCREADSIIRKGHTHETKPNPVSVHHK